MDEVAGWDHRHFSIKKLKPPLQISGNPSEGVTSDYITVLLCRRIELDFAPKGDENSRSKPDNNTI